MCRHQVIHKSTVYAHSLRIHPNFLRTIRYYSSYFYTFLFIKVLWQLIAKNFVPNQFDQNKNFISHTPSPSQSITHRHVSNAVVNNILKYFMYICKNKHDIMNLFRIKHSRVYQNFGLKVILKSVQRFLEILEHTCIHASIATKTRSFYF